MDRYIPTGNEMISLPTINEITCAVESVGFLSMAHRGLVEIRGTDAQPLMKPFVRIDGRETEFSEIFWQREHYWIPKMEARAGEVNVSMYILAPVHERGFIVRLCVKSAADVRATIGLRGCWGVTQHCVNEEKPVEGTRHCYRSGWNDGVIFDQRCGYPLFAFAPMCDRKMTSDFSCDDAIEYSVSHEADLCAGEEYAVDFFWGFGFEEVAAATSAKEMLRRAWTWEYKNTCAWLDARTHHFDSPLIDRLYNTNLFFCMFYATGVTMDTEELICATSRSPRYYVSAAYWDRDTLLWSFPAILDADRELARQVLEYVFTRQSRNIGVHSRYIDGTMLEPGFELDELMAPVLALDRYIAETGDQTLLTEKSVRNTVARILRTLASMRHSDVHLYETFLQPTDDERVYPYLTYDNVLVWKALNALARLYPDEYAHLFDEAERVRRAILDHCVFTDENGKPYFGWSVDLNGHHDIYDEPPGSLQLLAYLGFCENDDPVWLNTVDHIRSESYAYSFAHSPIAEIGCPHAPWPWVLSLCNSLLCGHERQAIAELELLKMDNGIACESVDAVTGECTTGAAFATCAGFFCHAIRTALGGVYEK